MAAGWFKAVSRLLVNKSFLWRIISLFSRRVLISIFMKDHSFCFRRVLRRVL